MLLEILDSACHRAKPTVDAATDVVRVVRRVGDRCINSFDRAGDENSLVSAMQAYLGPGAEASDAQPASAREGNAGENFLEVFFLPRTRDETELFYQMASAAGRDTRRQPDLVVRTACVRDEAVFLNTMKPRNIPAPCNAALLPAYKQIFPHWKHLHAFAAPKSGGAQKDAATAGGRGALGGGEGEGQDD